MDGRDFLTVARETIRGPTEAHWRTAAGRAYYALMLELRDTLERWGLSRSPQSNVHQAVRLRVYVSTDADMKQIGISLDELRKYRSLADYDTSAVLAFASDAKAQEMIQRATQALHVFDAIVADTPRRTTIAAEIRAVFP